MHKGVEKNCLCCYSDTILGSFDLSLHRTVQNGAKHVTSSSDLYLYVRTYANIYIYIYIYIYNYMGVVGVCVHDVLVNKGSLGGSESSLGSIHGDAATKAD